VTDHNAFLFAPFAEIHKRVLAYEVGLWFLGTCNNDPVTMVLGAYMPLSVVGGS
jgi:hypothetical protein